MYKLLIEKIEKDCFRAIIFEVFEDDKAVAHVLDNPMPWIWAEGKDGFITNDGLLYGVGLSDVHKNVDFGRAKNLGTMIKKICDQM
jgi:hypothetical protein